MYLLIFITFPLARKKQTGKMTFLFNHPYYIYILNILILYYFWHKKFVQGIWFIQQLPYVFQPVLNIIFSTNKGCWFKNAYMNKTCNNND